MQRKTGTDRVFRLNHTRVEAFSGVAADLFDVLLARRLTHYWEKGYADRPRRRQARWDRNWNGPVSVLDDGSVLAIRVLPLRSHT